MCPRHEPGVTTGRAVLFAILFAVAGLAGFALLSPLVFSGDLRRVGAISFPFIVVASAALGFVVGLRRKGR